MDVNVKKANKQKKLISLSNTWKLVTTNWYLERLSEGNAWTTTSLSDKGETHSRLLGEIECRRGFYPRTGARYSFRYHSTHLLSSSLFLSPNSVRKCVQIVYGQVHCYYWINSCSGPERGTQCALFNFDQSCCCYLNERWRTTDERVERTTDFLRRRFRLFLNLKLARTGTCRKSHHNCLWSSPPKSQKLETFTCNLFC